MARPAISPEERELRSNQILDAAVALWLEHPERMINVAEVAQRAGMAKGTVYLYFESKEDMLLAAHERHVDSFFQALITHLKSSTQVSFDSVMTVARDYILRQPAFLPLGTLVAAVMSKSVSQAAAEAFNARSEQRLFAAGEALCRHFPLHGTQEGVQLLMRSYALMLGFWQLVGNRSPLNQCAGVLEMMRHDYEQGVEAGLRALWAGTFDKGEGHAKCLDYVGAERAAGSVRQKGSAARAGSSGEDDAGRPAERSEQTQFTW
ncbi:MAG: TetR/AcrR family transcriptional regulator [Pseudomonadota bacterium]